MSLNLTVNQVYKPITTNNFIFTGHVDSECSISVELGSYDTFVLATANGDWECEVTFQNIFDGLTEIKITAFDGLIAEEVILNVDFLAPFYEDDYITVTPNPRIVQNYSILSTVTSKVESITIEAGTNKDIEFYNYRAIDTIQIPILETTKLWIFLSSQRSYSFPYTINRTGQIKSLDLILSSDNGLQFLSEQESLPPSFVTTKQYNFLKIDNNKYLRA